MSMMIVRNAAIVDGSQDRIADPVDFITEGGLIVEVGAQLKAPAEAVVVDLQGLTVMPGLIDCHVHVVTATANLRDNADMPNSVIAIEAAENMKAMLQRGFTTVRDLGGADHGLVQVVEAGVVPGPRLVICGKALSQTGGHTDYRHGQDHADASYYRDKLGALGRICDGVAEVRKACREELKAGATFIKVMANGGVSSPNDPIDALGFGVEELAAAVDEANSRHTYVAAHLYTDEAIRRALDAGVRSIEHANLILPETARRMHVAGAVAVPTNVTYAVVAKDGARFGMSPRSMAKIEYVLDAGLKAVETLRQAEVVMGYGSDLLGEMQPHQSEEFILRGQVLPAHEVIRSATIDAAKVLQMEDEVGSIKPGAHADFIAIDGDPLKNLAVLTQHARIKKIFKGGRLFKDG